MAAVVFSGLPFTIYLLGFCFNLDILFGSFLFFLYWAAQFLGPIVLGLPYLWS